MPEPLKVYLDSQDFSRLSGTDPMALEYVPTKEALLDLRHRDVAKFLFSDIHVFENLPTNPERASEGIARIDVMVELCGKHNLPSSSAVIEYEIKRQAAAKGYYRGSVIQPEDWFPDFDLDTKGTVDISAIMKAEAAKYPELQRWQRRAAVKKALKGRRSMSLDEANQVGLKELMAKYPIRKSDTTRLLAFLRGDLRRNELMDVVKDGLRDIALFGRWYVDNWMEGQPFVQSLRDGGADFHASLSRFYDDMRHVHVSVKDSHAMEDVSAVIATTFKQVREEFLDRGPRTMAERILGLSLPEGVLRMNPEDMPSILSMYDYLSRVLLQSAPKEHARNPHKKKPSDFSDGMHAIFLPMVDVFRADAQSQALLGQQGTKQRSKLAPTLKDLPTFIERMAESRC